MRVYNMEFSSIYSVYMTVHYSSSMSIQNYFILPIYIKMKPNFLHQYSNRIYKKESQIFFILHSSPHL